MTSASNLDHLIQYLPHKPPCLYLEHVTEHESGKSVRGSTMFPSGHRIFENHLPGEPLVPGVIIIEALAQLSGIALMDPAGSPVRGYLVEVEKMRFFRLVVPGETIELAAELQEAFGQFARFAVSAMVDGKLSARGVITLARKDTGASSE